MACGELRDGVGGQRRAVGVGLVEGGGDLRQQLRGLRAEDRLVVVGAEALGDRPRAAQLVEAALVKADRERPQALAGLLRRERGQQPGVDAATQPDADRHVADEVRADAVTQPRRELLRELALVLRAHVARRRGRGAAPAPDLRRVAWAPVQQRAGLELADVAEDRQRRGDRVEREVRLERVGVELAAKAWHRAQRLELGCEAQQPARRAPVQRLDAEAVAREQQPALARVPDGEGEHPAQVLEHALAALLVEVDEDLGVAAGGEAVAGALEIVPQRRVVEDLAVLHDVHGAVLGRDRLAAAGEVDDRQPPRGEGHRPGDGRRRVIGAAVDERRAHRLQRRRVDGAAVEGGETADPAHALSLIHI